jgi:hypothetical protein
LSSYGAGWKWLQLKTGATKPLPINPVDITLKMIVMISERILAERVVAPAVIA